MALLRAIKSLDGLKVDNDDQKVGITIVKKALTTIEDGEAVEARTATLQAIQALDKAAEKGVLHKNNVARRKSRLMKHLAALEKQA